MMYAIGQMTRAGFAGLTFVGHRGEGPASSRRTCMIALKSHPFPVSAHFDRVAAVSFAFPEATLQSLVPRGLEMDSYHGFGFVTVAMVWTRGLRPTGFPACLGQDFFLAGYRIFTRLCDGSGRTLRGLTILQSNTDKRRMAWLGNLFTGYRYRRVKVAISNREAQTRVQTSDASGLRLLDLEFDARGQRAVELPAGSPFPDWRTARRFAGPMPFTFSPRSDGRFTVIEGSREHWRPRPIHVTAWRVALFDTPPFAGAKPILANAFAVEDIDYRWSKGRVIKPGGAA